MPEEIRKAKRTTTAEVMKAVLPSSSFLTVCPGMEFILLHTSSFYLRIPFETDTESPNSVFAELANPITVSRTANLPSIGHNTSHMIES